MINKQQLPYNENLPHFRIGHGKSNAQFGELFQGQIYRDGRLRRCLLSLPCDILTSEARFEPSNTFPLSVNPPHKEKAKRAASLALSFLGLTDTGGMLTLHSNIPEAKGCGSSTADCIASTLAVGNAFGKHFFPIEIARIVVEAEVASGNMMFESAGLFAHREGIILDDYSQKLPTLEVLAFDTRTTEVVKTLEIPPAEYTSTEISIFEDLTGDLRRAIETNDARLLGQISTTSARINERFLPKYNFGEILEIASSVEALGIAVAHSGTVSSILLDPSDILIGEKVRFIGACLHHLGIESVLRFST
jgi:uncharacterized protein involved in propanediol utilization